MFGWYVTNFQSFTIGQVFPVESVASPMDEASKLMYVTTGNDM